MFVFDLAWLITATVLFVGCVLQTALGFGMAVLAAPVVMLIAPQWVPYVLTTTALCVSGINACCLYKDIHLRSVFSAMLARIPGTLIGAWLLIMMNVLLLQAIVAFAVLLSVLVSVKQRRFESTPSRMAWAGFASGFMGTTTAIGGPPLALVMQHGSARVVRANFSIYFTYSCLLSLLSYWGLGLLSWSLLLQCLTFVPVAVLGFFVGRRVSPLVEGRFRQWTLILSTVASFFALGGVAFRVMH